MTEMGEISDQDFIVTVADEQHCRYALEICAEMEISANQRGTGIAKRDPNYIMGKMRDGKSVIAIYRDAATAQEKVAGFCYIETWSDKKYVANSGLIVFPAYRKHGLARIIKRRAFELSREKYPDAKLFGITTSLAVMKINTELGYVPVPFSELTDDAEFWDGCASCPNFDILNRTKHRMCLCTGMLYDPENPHPHIAATLESLIELTSRTSADAQPE
jgi:hypothetical protein